MAYDADDPVLTSPICIFVVTIFCSIVQFLYNFRFFSRRYSPYSDSKSLSFFGAPKERTPVVYDIRDNKDEQNPVISPMSGAFDPRVSPPLLNKTQEAGVDIISSPVAGSNRSSTARIVSMEIARTAQISKESTSSV